MRKMLCLLLLCCVLAGAAAAEEIGQPYRDFVASYAENIVFINENTGRHLLPHTPVREYDSKGERLYRITGGALDTVIYLDDLDQQIASCRVTLTAPAHMRYGDAAYHNFSTAGYHSYALIMSMDKAASALERYQLVEQINEGLAAGGGQYETRVGDYWLTCTNANGVAVMLFENELLLPHEAITPGEDDVPDEEGGEEGEEGGEDEFLG